MRVLRQRSCEATRRMGQRRIEIQSKITEAVFEVACVATLVPRSLLLNRRETLATQAIFEEMKVLVVDLVLTTTQNLKQNLAVLPSWKFVSPDLMILHN